MTEASAQLGILSHYYADICIPYHAASEWAGQDDHYERDVEYNHQWAYDNYPMGAESWIATRAPLPITDIRKRAIAASVSASRLASDLGNYYRLDDSPYDGILGPEVLAITKTTLSRAVNDLADAIRTIPTGAGVSEVGTLRTRFVRPYLASDMNASLLTTVTDSRGRPIQGAKVFVTWATASGQVIQTKYSDAAGSVWSFQNVGTDPPRRAIGVAVATGHGTSTATASARCVVTDVLATGSSGFTTSLSPYHPSRYTTVTATASLRNTTGAAVAGARVYFTWTYGSTAFRYSSVTDSSGIAVCAKNIRGAPIGRPVLVRAEVQWGGVMRASSETFTPSVNISHMAVRFTDAVTRSESLVHASVRCIDEAHNPVRGRLVAFRWTTPSGVRFTYAYTDSRGIARSSKSTQAMNRGYRLRLQASARTWWGTRIRSTSALLR